MVGTESAAEPGWVSVPLAEATMHRRLVVTTRANAYLSPAARRLLELFELHHGAA